MGGDRRIGDMEVLLVAARRLRFDDDAADADLAVTVAADSSVPDDVAAAPAALRRRLPVKSGARRRRLVVGLAFTSAEPAPVPEVCVLLLSLVWAGIG